MPAKSIIWNFFSKVDNDSATCNTCETTLLCKGGTTTGLINHLKSKSHEEAFKSYNEMKSSRKRPSSSEADVTSQPKQAKVDSFFGKSSSFNIKKTQKELDDALVHFLSDSHVAFRILNLESFKNIIKIASNGKLDVKSDNFYSKLVTEKADDIRQELLKIIERVKDDLTTVTFSSDMWTSVNGDSFLALTMHFISKDWSLYRFTPYVKPFPERHTGENISVGLDKMIEELGLNHPYMKLFCVNDNASNMKASIRLSQYLSEYLCDIHTLELVIKDGFNNTTRMIDVLRISKKIAKYVQKSSVGLRELKEACIKFNIKFLKPVNPPITRWSGFYKNLSSILYLKTPLTQLMADSANWVELNLTQLDWKLLEAAVTLLKPFCDTVLVFQSEAEVTMHHVVERIYTLNVTLKDFIRKNIQHNIVAAKFAKELQKSLETRFPNNGTDSKYPAIANYLCPMYKGMHLEETKCLDTVKIKIKVMGRMAMHASCTTSSCSPAHSSSLEEPNGDMSPTSKLRLKMQAKKSSTSSANGDSSECPIEKEMNRYELFSVPSYPTNILNWWKEHEKVLPELAKIARSILSIPCSSAKSERVFSTAGNFSTKKRYRLGAKKLEDLVILKENHQNILGFKADNPIDLTDVTSIPFNSVSIETVDSIPRDSLENEFFSDDDDDDENIDHVNLMNISDDNDVLLDEASDIVDIDDL